MKLNPDPRIRAIGVVLILLGLAHIAIGITLLLR